MDKKVIKPKRVRRPKGMRRIRVGRVGRGVPPKVPTGPINVFHHFPGISGGGSIASMIPSNYSPPVMEQMRPNESRNDLLSNIPLSGGGGGPIDPSMSPEEALQQVMFEVKPKQEVLPYRLTTDNLNLIEQAGKILGMPVKNRTGNDKKIVGDARKIVALYNGTNPGKNLQIDPIPRDPNEPVFK